MINKVAIIGMGALGLLYADQITSGLKDLDCVEFVMDSERAKRHANDLYTINGEEKHFHVIDAETASAADLVLVAVKYNSLPEALDTMKNSVGPNTIIISAMNGVTSEKIIAERYGMDKIVFTVAQGMDAMREGSSLKYTQCGKLHIGAVSEDMAGNLMTDGLHNSSFTAEERHLNVQKNLTAEDLHLKMQKNLQEVAGFFELAQVPHFVEEDIMYRMWFKYMLNIGINQTCMVFDTTYGVATTPGEISNEKMVGAMREVIPVAKAHGVNLTEADVQKCMEIEKTLDPDGYPSMAQDRKARRKSEVEMFAGEMIKMAKEIGSPYAYNQFFYDEVQKIEAKY